MDEVLYEDEECTYCWGDPRLEARFVSGRLTLFADGVRFFGEHDSLVWPKGAIKSIGYAPTYPVDLDEIARSQGIEVVQDIEVAITMGDAPLLAPKPALSLVVQDPEGVEVEGFDVRVMFRNEYYAKVFAKRASKALGMPFNAGTN